MGTDLRRDCGAGLVIDRADVLVGEFVDAILETGFFEAVEQALAGGSNVLAVDVEAVGLPVEAAELDVAAAAACDLGGDHIAVEQDEAEHVHKVRAPRVVAAETDVTVEPPSAVAIGKNAVPERLEARGVKTIEVEVRHPGDHLRLPREGLRHELGDDLLDLVDVERAGGFGSAVTFLAPQAIGGKAAVIGVFPARVGRVVHILDPVVFRALYLHHVLA